ncbi:MAG: hypothetical protein JWN48_5130 [Myxococcaceae bacterium]|nr:hypothetical protein [Myxococcaceae bacterium]
MKHRLQTLGFIGLTACAAVVASRAGAQEDKLDEANNRDEEAKQYAGTRWSLVKPDGDFEDGCATGYMTFQLRPNGYFIFNNRISGSWSVNKTGNVRLRVRNGGTVLLTIEGKTAHVARNPLFTKRGHAFQRCQD